MDGWIKGLIGWLKACFWMDEKLDRWINEVFFLYG